MKTLKISQIQFEAKSTPQENCNQLEIFYKKAFQYKPDLICTPECSNIITNDNKHLFKFANFQNECPILKMSKKFAKEHNVHINVGSLLLKKKNQKRLVNRSFVIDQNGKIKSYYDKIHMFDVNINSKEMHKESHSFKPGKKITLTKIKNIKFGLTICYDLRFPNLFRELAKKGAEVILSPAAFTVPTGKDHWEILTRARAIENNVFLIATNMCGTHHTKRKTYGHSVLVSPWGKLLKKGFKKQVILNTKIDLNDVVKSRKRIPSLSHD